LWWSVGADRDGGGFHEAIGHDGRPTGAVRRARVQARQIFAYAVAGDLHWAGPWRSAVDHGLDCLLGRYRRPHALFHHAFDSDGRPSDAAPYLYEQAFALLALATAAAAGARDWELQPIALALLDRLRRERRGPAGGFTGFPDGALFQTDPHMHLLE